MSKNLSELLQSNAYPGRGIVLGCSEDGEKAYAAYFIMGRSANSRNRVFSLTGEELVTEAADPAGVEDPSLILYRAVRRYENRLIITNGDQTDTVYEGFEAGKGFAEALEQRTFEPDAPNYTPRISGLLTSVDGAFSYELSILKSAGGNPESAQRFFYRYAQPLAGEGHFIHTYKNDGNPLPSFCGEPVTVAVKGTAREFGQMIWNSLNEENKIALYVCEVSRSGEGQAFVLNKYSKVTA